MTKSKGGCLDSRDVGSETGEHCSAGGEARAGKTSLHFFKDGPEDFALCFVQARFAAEARDISIGLPGGDLPRIDDLIPFAPQELRSKSICWYGGLGRFVE